MTKKTITLIETSFGHWYKIEDPTSNDFVYFPGLTNVLEAFPNKGLDFWRENTSPEQIRKAQEDGKIQGSKVHNLAELQILGDTVQSEGLSDAQISLLGLSDKKLVSYLKEPLTEREESCLVGLENFWEEFKPITVKSELMVYSAQYGYAGTLDWVGYLWDKKTKKHDLWIIDFKISKTLDRSYDLQITGYWQALQETYKKKLPKARLGILQLGKNKCNYSFKEVRDRTTCMDLLIKTKAIWDDINKSKEPALIQRRESFNLKKYSKKGRIIKL